MPVARQCYWVSSGYKSSCWYKIYSLPMLMLNWRNVLKPAVGTFYRFYIHPMNWSWLSDTTSSRWPHNDHAGVSNHQPHGCSLDRLFKRKSKKTPLKFRVTDLCAGNSLGPANSPHKRIVTRKMFPFDDVIMWPHRSGSIESDKTTSIYNVSTRVLSKK